MKRIQLLLFLLIVLVLSSCSNRKAEVAREFAQWIGREIVFPDSMTFVIVNDTVDIDLNSYDYKIVTYVDSTGCTPCRMKLQQWNEFIDEFKSIPDLDIEVLVVVNSSDTNNIHNILKSDNYLNPVTTDGKNTFAKSNDLPDKYEFQTFLVDAENKVVAVGNPVINPKIKELYKLMISDEGSKTDMYCKLQGRALGVVRPNDDVSTIFSIPNTDSITYHIQAIVPSCDCVTATARVDSIRPGDEDIIEVSFKSDSIVGSFKKYVDIYYKEKDNPDRLTICGFVK